MNKPLYFIQPHILDRLHSGQFVPERASQLGTLRNSGGPERRVLVSPLAVAKRCIRYEPLVFFNRLQELFLLAAALNPAIAGECDKKLLLIDGPSGSGKTTLMRGVVELMGGGPEQLLWIELSPLSDPDLILRFMFEQLMRQARNRIPVEEFLSFNDPLKAIGQLLNALPDWPLLIVLDQVQHFVQATEIPHFISPLLKDALNFLLEFPQIKLVLIGEKLPYGDLSPHHPACFQHTVLPLPPEASLTLLKAIRQGKQKNGDHPSQLPDTLLESLTLTDSWRYPEQLRFVAKLSTVASIDLSDAFNASQEISKSLLKALWLLLPQQAQTLLAFLALVSHPLDTSELADLVKGQAGFSMPPVSTDFVIVTHPTDSFLEPVRQLLKSSLLACMLRFGLSPQYALLTLEADTKPVPPSPLFTQGREPSTSSSAASSGFNAISQHIAYQVYPWLQTALHTVLVEHYSPQERAGFHQILTAFYEQQASQTELLASCQKAPEKLLSEARHHQAQARLLLQSLGADPLPFNPLFISEKRVSPAVVAPHVEGSWSIRSYLAQKN